MDQVHHQLQAHAKRWPLWWESLDSLKGMLELRRDLAEAWEVGNLQRYLAHLLEVAPFSRPSPGCLLLPMVQPGPPRSSHASWQRSM